MDFDINDIDMLKDIIRELEAKCQSLNEEIQQLRGQPEMSFRDGMINGLKFAIRCNGISGKDVR